MRSSRNAIGLKYLQIKILKSPPPGIPASESVKGLTKRERSAQGKSGGVVRLAYMTALVPPVGKSLAETNVGSGPMSIEVGEVSRS